MTNESVIEKKVKMNLVGLDGNAFSLMGAFSRNAKQQGWTKDEIDVVLKICMSGDYENLISTLVEYTEEVGEEE
jgi:hypothetical protein